MAKTSPKEDAKDKSLDVLWREFGPQFRRRARTRLRQYGLTGQTESMDICNDVMADLAGRSNGQPLNADDVLAYIMRAIDNQVLDTFRTLARHCRDFRRNDPTPVEDIKVIQQASSPSQVALRREMINRVRAVLGNKGRRRDRHDAGKQKLDRDRRCNWCSARCRKDARSACTRSSSRRPGAFGRRSLRTLEGLVDLLGDWRRSNPDAPLSQLIKDNDQVADHLLDLACIDLINRRRSGRQASAKYYAEDLSLHDDESLLDLIDAEICVDRELGIRIEASNYVQRYPKFSSEIQELCDMSPQGSETVARLDIGLIGNQAISAPLISSADTMDPIDSCDFSIDAERQPKAETTLVDHPVDIPSWFVRQQCIVSGQGHWLLRGRDNTRNLSLAMKIIRLPTQINEFEIGELLDICERSANVSNRCWLAPEVAAVQDRHLAVVRPWSYAVPWQDHCNIVDHVARTKQLAMIAYSLQAAHRAGATHGGVHAGNVLIDHDGNAKLVDGSSSSRGSHRWLTGTRGVLSWADRQLGDVNDLVRLITNEIVEWPFDLTNGLLPELRRLADFYRDEACAAIGDKLMHWSDHELIDGSFGGPRRQSWRSRLARWLQS